MDTNDLFISYQSDRSATEKRTRCAREIKNMREINRTMKAQPSFLFYSIDQMKDIDKS